MAPICQTYIILISFTQERSEIKLKHVFFLTHHKSGVDQGLRIIKFSRLEIKQPYSERDETFVKIK